MKIENASAASGSNAANSVPRSAARLVISPLPRLAWALAWIALAWITADFLAAVYGKYRQVDPTTYAMFWTRQGWLWTHLSGGALAVVLGPLQFLTRWPSVWPRLHRWMGRVYVGGLLVASVGATGLIATSPAPMGIRVAFACTATAWLTTALVALVAIYSGRVALHRRWMIRNYLVTLAPISFRFALPACIALGWMPSPEMIATLLWGSWLVPVLVYEAVRRAVAFVRAAAGHRAPAAVLADPAG